MTQMYKIGSVHERVKFLREAAEVERCHTTRHIGEYSVGKHSFNMLAMLRLLWPEAPISLVWAILEHDLPERLTGDIPSPSIHAGLIEAQAMWEMEEAILRELFGVQFFVGIEGEELKWLKGLDLLELYLYGLDQIMLGNQNFKMMVVRIDDRFIRNNHMYPKPILDLFYEVRGSEWNHMPDLGGK